MTQRSFMMGEMGPFYYEDTDICPLDGVTLMHPLVMEVDGVNDNQAIRRRQLYGTGSAETIRLPEIAPGDVPGAVADTGWLYSLDVGGITELYYGDSDGNSIQLTDNGSLNLGAIDLSDYLPRDGTEEMTANWDAGGFIIQTDEIRAHDGAGLYLREDSGTAGIFIGDAGGFYVFDSTGTERMHSLSAGTGLELHYGTLNLSNQTVDITLNAAVDALNFASNLLSLDNSNGRIGIGTAAPDVHIHSAASAGYNNFYHDVFSTTAGDRPTLFFRHSKHNTIGTAAQTDDGTVLWDIRAYGCDTGNNFDLGAHFYAIQDGAAGTRVPTNVVFNTYSNSAANAAHLVLHGPDGRTGFGTASPDSCVEIETSATCAVPGLKVDQNDADQHGMDIEFATSGANGEFIYFTGTSDSADPPAGNIWEGTESYMDYCGYVKVGVSSIGSDLWVKVFTYSGP